MSETILPHHVPNTRGLVGSEHAAVLLRSLAWLTYAWPYYLAGGDPGRHAHSAVSVLLKWALDTLADGLDTLPAWERTMDAALTGQPPARIPDAPPRRPITPALIAVYLEGLAFLSSGAGTMLGELDLDTEDREAVTQGISWLAEQLAAATREGAS